MSHSGNIRQVGIKNGVFNWDNRRILNGEMKKERNAGLLESVLRYGLFFENDISYE